MTSSKTEYSRYLNRVTFDEGVLRVSGQRRLVALVLFAFFAVCLGLLFSEMPVIAKFGIGVALPFLLWGFVDVVCSRSEMTFDVSSQQISLHRKSLNHEIRYDGNVEGLHEITMRRQPGSDSINSYEILFVFDDGSSRVPFILESVVGQEVAAQKVAAWEEQLGLDVAVV